MRAAVPRRQQPSRRNGLVSRLERSKPAISTDIVTSAQPVPLGRATRRAAEPLRAASRYRSTENRLRAILGGVSAGPDPDPELSAALLEQIFSLWVEPELERRGLDLDRDGVSQALVVMAPGRGVETLINEEARLLARIHAARAIDAGEMVPVEDLGEVASVEPHAIDPDAGWICFARIGEDIVIAFDFRRNRARAGRLVERAREFIHTARLAHAASLWGPSIEAAFAAAELAVVAQMLLTDDQPPREHPVRRRWFVGWTELGNAPDSHSRAITTLAKHRRGARYAERAVRLTGDRLEAILDVVDEMVDHSASAIAPTVP